MPKLVLRRKTEIIIEFLISKANVTVGSSEDNDIVINDQPISLRHCEVFEAEGKYYVKDLKSAFGTYINKKRVGQSEIKYGDTINLSNSVFDILFYPVPEELDQQQEIPDRYFLLAIQGKLYGKKYEVKEGETRIGRDEEFNDIAISGKLDASVSRRHATLLFKDGNLSITDKRSRNRTFVNQKVVGESESLDVYLGDEILVGHNIFRYVSEGEEDYSAPKKAGIFLDRYKIPALKLLAGLTILGSICSIFYSTYRILIINNRPVQLAVQKTGWEPKINVTDNYSSIEGEAILSPSPAVGSRGSRKEKVVAITGRNGNIYLINPKTGASAWPQKFTIKAGISGSPVLVDINSDSISDVVVCGNDSRLYFIDGLSGELIYKSEILGGKLSSTPACADFDGDGRIDAVCSSEEGVVLFVYSPANSPRTYVTDLSEKTYSSPVIYTDPYTKRVKACIALASGKVYFFDCFDRNYFMLDTAEGINRRKGTSLTTNDIGNVPLVADFNNDGDMDLVVASKHNFIASFNIRTTDMQWEYTIPEKVKDFPDKYPSLVAAELNNDDKLDIIAAWPNGRIYAIDGETGGLLWKQQTDEWNRFIATPALADLNKDGFADVIIGSENGYIYVFDGMAGIGMDMDRTLKKEKVSANPIYSTPIIADFDGNGYMDIIYTDSLMKTGLLKTNTRVLPGEYAWAMQHGDPMNTGAFKVNTYLWLFVLLDIISIILIISVIATMFILRRRKGVKKPPIIALKEEVTY